MESKKHKKKINYEVMLVSDSPGGGIKSFHFRSGLIMGAVFFLVMILAGAIGYSAYSSSVLKSVQSEKEELLAELGKLGEENKNLAAENTELSDKVAVLSDTVNMKLAKEEELAAEEESKRVPRGFPFAGPAVILESSETVSTVREEETEDKEDNPIVVFSASVGTKVIATADGRVESIEPDETYGYCMTIDHNNEYTSFYRMESTPVVEEGAEITLGETLVEFQNEDEKMGYQIKKDDKYIDPLELMEVYG